MDIWKIYNIAEFIEILQTLAMIHGHNIPLLFSTDEESPRTILASNSQSVRTSDGLVLILKEYKSNES